MARLRMSELYERLLGKVYPVTTLVFDKPMGLRLKRIRESMGLSQADLGDLLGLSQTDIHRLETGKMSVAPLTCEEFRIRLKQNFEYLLHEEGYFKEGALTWRRDKKYGEWICEEK